jgi:hypothetical protein
MCQESADLFPCQAEKGNSMGQKDISLVRYFEDEDRYADLINGFIFDGERFVSGDDIQELDSRITGFLSKIKDGFKIQKYRDSVRKVVLGLGFAIIGLENQDRVHHAMPIRIMLEDAAGYDKQMRRIQKHHRKRKDLQGDEFLGGFSIRDKVYPVIAICIYYGDKPYNGAKELYQILEYETLPDKLKVFLNNYKIHVLEIRSFHDIDRFKTDLREVFGFIQRSGNPAEEQKFTFENKERFQKMDEDAFDVITTVTGSKELELIKDDYRDERGKINMCEAILGMIEAGRVEGRTHGEAKIVAIIRKKYIKKKNLQIISDELELDYSYVKEVVDLIHEHPDWTDLQIGEALIMHDNF